MAYVSKVEQIRQFLLSLVPIIRLVQFLCVLVDKWTRIPTQQECAIWRQYAKVMSLSLSVHALKFLFYNNYIFY